jgi:hypothetical protein
MLAYRPPVTHGEDDAGLPPPDEKADVLRAASPPPELIEPPRPSVVKWRVALLVGIALALLVPVAALARTSTDLPRAAAAVSQSVEAPTAEASEARAPTVWERIATVLYAQSQALVAGDLAGYLAPIEPGNAGLRDAFTRRFASLRALQVATWDQTPGSVAEGPETWGMDLTVTYCFVTRDCPKVTIRLTTRWVVTPAAVWLRQYDNVHNDRVLPWDVSDLRASVGRRVIVATTAKFASRLPAIVTAADKAADVADRFARWGPPPNRYLVFIAGPDEWAKWYSGEKSKWVAGYATRVSFDVTDVVLNANRVPNGQAGYVLRHELAHVVTLNSADEGGNWWLVEGIAEYVRVAGGGTPFDGVSDVRRYVRSGRWSGGVALDAPAENASVYDVRGYYGIAYLAVRRIADRYGEAKMLEFFDLAERKGMTLEQASTQALGADWGAVAADCAHYVRSRT